MIEILNNNKPEFIMDIKKFVQSKKGLMFSDEKILIEGKFKEKGSKEVFSGDNFAVHKIWKSGEKLNAELIYKTYLEWFNYTLKEGEKERFFISAKFGSGILK